jgi:hypothetical protein
MTTTVEVSTPSTQRIAPSAPSQSHLPGGYLTLGFAPHIHNLMSHRQARFAHGLLSTLLGVEFGQSYTAASAAFALIPQPRLGLWGVWLAEDLYLSLANQRRVVEWEPDSGRRVLTFGPLTKFRLPPLSVAGMYEVSIETRTPLVIQVNNPQRLTKLFPSQTVYGALCNIENRIEMNGPRPKWLEVNVFSQRLFWSKNYVGGRWNRGTADAGVVGGVEGNLTLHCDERALWLLRVAEMIGFGGCTSVGFGRILIEYARAI